MASVVAAPPPPPPPPLSPAPMTSRRVPLGTLPNAANSNHHGTTAPPAKRPRSQSTSQQREGNYIEKPVVKKQYVEISPTAPSPQPTPRTPVRNRIDTKAMPPRRGTNRIRNVGGSPPPFNPILRSQQPQRRTGVESNTAMAGEVRTRNNASVVSNANTTTTNNASTVAENMEKIRAWQAHYRKVFPTFVFYFESFPEESVAKYQKQVHGLGAQVEKFFSNTVTHVVTTRPIPPEIPLTKQKIQPPLQRATITSTSRTSVAYEKGMFNGQIHAKTEFTFKAPQGTKKFPTLGRQDNLGRVISYEESRTQQAYSNILLKAREFGIKIWALEKLQRMLNAMAEGEPQPHTHTRGDQDVGNRAAVAAQDEQLSRLLRNERIHGPSDRDPDALSKDMVYFSGPFVMVKDLKATHKPIMVREYEKVSKREDGQWPQFRSTASGKCPFIDDQVSAKERERERERETREMKEWREEERRRELKEEDAAKQGIVGRMQPPAPRAPRQVEGTTQARRSSRTLGDLNPGDNRPDYGRNAVATSRAQPTGSTRLFNVPSVVPAKRISNEMAFTSTNTTSHKGVSGQNPNYAYEPVASGLQPSNITSAIRSQMVSSHLDIPGAKTGMSRDMLELKRKAAGNVVEIGRRSVTAGSGSISRATGARNLTEIAALKPEPKTAHRKESFENLGKEVPIFQDLTEEPVARDRGRRQLAATEVKKMLKKEPKPGYCENCREKFDDFDDHTLSRRHRKFAQNDSNFTDLDDLLAKLQRPLRQRYHNSH